MPLTILLLAANPDDTGQLKLDEEARTIDAVLRRAEFRDRFEVRSHWAVRYEDLQALLLRHKPEIVHFSGHGNRAGAIALKNERGTTQLVPPEQLASLFAILKHDNMRCVVLNACYSERQAHGIAQSVEFVVGMQRAIQDSSAIEFAAGFYLGLGYGRSMQEAFELGCNRIGLAQGQGLVRRNLRPPGAGTAAASSAPAGDATIPQLIALRSDPAQVVLAAPTLSPLHLEYLRSWFGKPWATVSLADIVEGSDEQISLLDVYVPLPVDFGINVVTKEQLIVDWWAAREPAGGEREQRQLAHREPLARRQAADGYPPEGLAAGAEPMKLRRWPELNVEEDGLQRIVAGIQQKITERQAGGEETKDGEQWWYMEAHDAASIQPRFVLLGDPGSGKSSFLHHLTLCMAGELRRRAGDAGVPDKAGIPALRDWLLDTFTPIFVELRDLVRTVFPPLPDDGRPLNLPDAGTFWRYMHEHALGGGLAAFENDLRTLCRDGQAILLLDGLDEVNNAADTNRRNQIKALMAALVHTYPALRIIVTSRPHAYRTGEWALEGFGRAMLEPLSLNRLHELAQALFPVALADGARDEAAAFVEALNQAERSRQLDRTLYANPLFFTLLAALWLDARPPRRLPGTRAELLRRGVDLLLQRWTQRRLPDPSVADGLGVPNPADLRQVLETLACTVHATAQPGSDSMIFDVDLLLGLLFRARCKVMIDEVPDYLTQHAGILVSPSPNYFYFIHRAFQEHLAACLLICETPEQHKPPVDPGLRFPSGLRRLPLEQPDLWENVVHLAADELLTHLPRRLEGWHLLVELCTPYLDQRTAPSTALLALQIAARHQLLETALERFDARRELLIALRESAVAVLTDVANFPDPAQRDLAGQLLGQVPGGDPRPGAGLCNERDSRLNAGALPDILWVKVPAADAQGRREFIYQDGERRTEADFWIARYPVTYRQFQAFVDAPDGYRNPEWWKGLANDYSAAGATRYKQRFEFWNHPRDNLTWYEAVAFCRWLTACARTAPEILPVEVRGAAGWRITLPTEWQWEKTARGFDGRQYPWGPEYQVGFANVDETSTKAGPHYLQKSSAVGMYPHGAAAGATHDLRVDDLSGNVWEWCLNEYETPANIQESGDQRRVLRGGSWDNNPDFAAASIRGRDDPDYINDGDGFRLVVSASP